ncbi:unnamed protein product [Phytomonas sp. EM1]|nr:unnamed protein product [Phytomonas sp. EM1]|eukprot:CCW63949.1 unnamed protein product [Phytomonas sp. isolate EM1]
MLRRLSTVAAASYACRASLMAFSEPLSTLRYSARFAGGLQTLLQDRDDKFLALTQELNLVKIAELANQAPFNLHRELPKHCTEFQSTASVGEIQNTGLNGENGEEPEQKRLQELYERLPAEKKEAVRVQRLMNHLRDALCSVNAVLRVEVGDQLEKVAGSGAAAPDSQKVTLPAQDLDAGLGVFHLVKKHQGMFSPEQWAEDMEPELKDFEALFKWTDDPRAASF